MKKKNRASAPTRQKKSRWQFRDENMVTKKFNAELQQAVDKVDWSKVKLPWLKGFDRANPDISYALGSMRMARWP